MSRAPLPEPALEEGVLLLAEHGEGRMKLASSRLEDRRLEMPPAQEAAVDDGIPENPVTGKGKTKPHRAAVHFGQRRVVGEGRVDHIRNVEYLAPEQKRELLGGS